MGYLEPSQVSARKHGSYLLLIVGHRKAFYEKGSIMKLFLPLQLVRVSHFSNAHESRRLQHKAKCDFFAMSDCN